VVRFDISKCSYLAEDIGRGDQLWAIFVGSNVSHLLAARLAHVVELAFDRLLLRGKRLQNEWL
jgi:hypothetical protein